MTKPEGWDEMTEEQRDAWVQAKNDELFPHLLEEAWNPGAAIRESATDDQRAATRSWQLSLMLPPDQIRRRAVLTFRCADCAGMPIAYVTYIDGRPGIWTRPHRKERDVWQAWFIDAQYMGANVAYCKTRQYAFDGDILAEHLPSPGAARRTEVRVRHDDSYAVR